MNNHERIEQFTKRVMKELYGAEVHVFFCDMFDYDIPIRAIFRTKDYPPYSGHDYETYKKNPQCSITFESRLFHENGELPPHTKNTIIHECTHYEAGIEHNEKTGRPRHPKDFATAYRRNLKKLKDLEF